MPHKEIAVQLQDLGLEVSIGRMRVCAIQQNSGCTHYVQGQVPEFQSRIDVYYR
jgi:hypothetical protein